MKNILIYNNVAAKTIKKIINSKKVSIIIELILLYIIFQYRIKIKINEIINSVEIELKDVDDYINNLNKYSIYREPKYILLFDYINLIDSHIYK